MPEEITVNSNKKPIIGAFIATIGASLCCVAPLVLVALGISGAWIGYLTALQPYSIYFSGMAIFFLGMAFYRLYLATPGCKPGDVCALPARRRDQRIIFWIATTVLGALLAFPYYGQIFFD